MNRSEQLERDAFESVVLDALPRKRLDQELMLLARLIDLAHDAIIVREPVTSAVMYWNQEAAELYGYSSMDARGQVTHELLATEFPVSREAVDEALRARGRWEGTLWHVRADRQRILVSSRQALIRDEQGTPMAVIELNSDITEQARAERALREAEQQFRGLVHSASDAMVIVDQQGTIVLANTRAEELFGYAREDLTGQPVEILLPAGLGHPHVTHRKGCSTDPNATAIGSGQALLARRNNGSEFAVEVSLSPLRADGELLVSAAIRDISKQLLRQLEQALVPRMRISPRWKLAWRYRPSLSTMLLGGDFIGVCERPDRSLSLLIGDVTGHGPAAAGTGAMLRAAWLGAAQAGVSVEALPSLLHHLLINQADRSASPLATVCLVEVDPEANELRVVRAGHDCPLMVARSGVVPVDSDHGPVLGLDVAADWPLTRTSLPDDGAIMLFTDGLTERRPAPNAPPLGYDDLLPRIDPAMMLDNAPGTAIDALLATIFPHGTEQLEDDLAVILLQFGTTTATRAGCSV